MQVPQKTRNRGHFYKLYGINCMDAWFLAWPSPCTARRPYRWKCQSTLKWKCLWKIWEIYRSHRKVIKPMHCNGNSNKKWKLSRKAGESVVMLLAVLFLDLTNKFILIWLTGPITSPPDPNDEKSEWVDAVADDFVASAKSECQPKTLQSRVRC